MASGDIYVGGPTSVNIGDFLTIQPAAGVEAVVINIYHGDKAIEVYYSDGTNDIKIDAGESGGLSLMGRSLGVTNARYLKVKNVSGSAAYLGWTGMYTK